MNYYQLLSLERPEGMVGEPEEYPEEMTYMLPRKAQDNGMVMFDLTYRQPALRYRTSYRDPLIIFDREGRILHQFPDDHVPGFFEIQKVCRRILRRKQFR